MTSLRKLARGQPCRLRIPNICAPGPQNESVVLCHIKRGWLGSLKPPDIIAVTGCSACHAAIDGRQKVEYTREQMDAMILRALCEQLEYYAARGILKW